MLQTLDRLLVQWKLRHTGAGYRDGSTRGLPSSESAQSEDAHKSSVLSFQELLMTTETVTRVQELVDEGERDRGGLCTQFDNCWHCRVLTALLAVSSPQQILTVGDSDNPQRGSEHSRIDGDVPAAQVAALQRQRPRRDKSTGHEQGDQEAERPTVRTDTAVSSRPQREPNMKEEAARVGEQTVMPQERATAMENPSHSYKEFPNPIRALALECVVVGQSDYRSCRCDEIDFTDWPKDIRAACGFCRVVDGVERRIRDAFKEASQGTTAAASSRLENKAEKTDTRVDGNG